MRAAGNKEISGVAAIRRDGVSRSKRVTIFDEVHSKEEERWVTLGIDRAGSLLVVCHPFREDKNTSDLRTPER
jgi:uncharacterized DUF497 family protein